MKIWHDYSYIEDCDNVWIARGYHKGAWPHPAAAS